MKLTAKRAVVLSIELWEWLAETGLDKEGWPKWKRNGGKYSDEIEGDCFLCEYAQGGCGKCPYDIKYGECICGDMNAPTLYDEWEVAGTEEDAKKYAKQFLEQLKEILKEINNDTTNYKS